MSGVLPIASDWNISRLAAWGGIAAAILLLWWSPFDHPLYPPDEGRYGMVAATMAESGDWLVPQLHGQPHLTKPPLTYWLQAVGISMFGRSEVAVRLPSSIASTCVILLIFWATTAFRGRVAGVCAAMLYVILPEAMIVGRLASTDAILNLWWTLALASAFFAIRGGEIRWALTFWMAIALAALTKGPVAIGPLGIVVCWRALAGDLRSLLRLRPAWGIPLAMAPVAAWALAVGVREPDLWEVWWEQSVGRATGELGKRDVWWLYVPVFLLGMFPASAMLTLPGFNLSWRQAWLQLRDGSFASLCVVGVVLPVLAFSFSAGKLPTYLLPIAAPLAILVGSMLATNWIVPRATPGGTPPDVRITLLVCCAIAALAMPAVVLLFDVPQELHLPALAFLLPAAGAAWLVVCWRNDAKRRSAFLVAWAGFAAVWVVGFHVEDLLLEKESPKRLDATLARLIGDDGEVFFVGHTDSTWAFYRRGVVRDLGTEMKRADLRDAMLTAGAAIFGTADWEAFRRARPEFVPYLEPVETGVGFFNRSYVICRVHPMRPQSL